MKKKDISRRDFLKGAGILGAFAISAPLIFDPLQEALSEAREQRPHGTGDSFLNYTASDVIYTTCQQCNTFCTVKCVLQPGNGKATYTSLVRKIAGNPYSPLNMQPGGQIKYGTPVVAAALGTGALAVTGRGLRGGRTCLKGQAGIQIAYDAARIRNPLKRVGPRGSGQWKTITWEQALDEIINGSPDLGTPGLKEMWAYVPKKAVMEDWEKVKNGEMIFEEFDAKYKKALIDTKHPDLGPKSNQIVHLGGDRLNFIHDRVWAQGFGSINAFHHGGICGMSGVIGNQRSYTGEKQKQRMYADVEHTEFLIVWGTDPLVSNKGPTWLAPVMTNALARGMKMAVVDPRLSKSAEKAHIWVPVQPGTDGALALGMARWIIENGRYDERYLKNPGKKAADLDGEPTWTDATHLVNVSDPKKPKVKPADLGLKIEPKPVIGPDGQPKLTPEGQPVFADQFMVLSGGLPMLYAEAEDADLEVDTVINGIQVKSIFTLFKERVMEKTLAQYAEVCRIDPELIVTLAREFTSHGKRSAIVSYRGPAMHTNGYYNIRAINTLNHLIGNHDWKGGDMFTGARFKETKGVYDLTTVPNAKKAWGISMVRRGVKYEETTLFKRDGYPAKRTWYPYTNHLTHEVLPSAVDGYPYPIKALFLHRISPVTSVPAAGKQEEILKDIKAIPLLVAFDVVVGESSQYADFLLPDTTYLERWGLQTIYPNQRLKESHFIQPVTRVFPEPRSVDDVLIDILKLMKLPGAGENAFPDGSPLNRAEDYYLKLVANIALDGTPVPDADADEMKVFVEARRKGLGEAFNQEAWTRAVKPEEWAKVVYVLNRGGRFEAPGSDYVGEHIKYRWGAQCNFYDEPVGKGKHPVSEKPFDALPKVEEVAFANGNPAKDSNPLALIDWKSRNLGTHRTISSAWLREVRSSNYLWMNPVDAGPRGLRTGDQIKVQSSTAEVIATVLVTEGIKPGVVGAAYNYGHTAYGTNTVEIDGAARPIVGKRYGHTPFTLGAPMQEEAGLALGRDSGFSTNWVHANDPSLGNTSMSDPIGGSASQLDTWVEVVKA